MKTLYHASSLKQLKVIHPQRTLSRDIYIGDYVFATSDIKLAAMYMATKGIGTLMDYESESPTIAICSDEQAYIRNDVGGAIYTVPSKTFQQSPQDGLAKSEQVSNVAVKPQTEKMYTRSIDAMQELGITIYFVDQSTFDRLVQAKQEDEKKILAGLQPYND